ncbi:MAG: hypothetical protein ACLP5V_04245 [Candidatus Bathyarchaeia archaeon]
MIDQVRRRPGLGLCEMCEREPATRKAMFKAQYLQSTSAAVFDEESLVDVEMTKRICEGCLKKLQDAKNVTDLTYDRL